MKKKKKPKILAFMDIEDALYRVDRKVKRLILEITEVGWKFNTSKKAFVSGRLGNWETFSVWTRVYGQSVEVSMGVYYTGQQNFTFS